MVSSLSILPEFKADRVDPEAAPRLMVGATSPLWLMFGGAAAAGATWWWWASRWRQAVNLEALTALTPEPVATPLPTAEALVGQAVETAEAAFEAVAEPLETAAELALEATVEVIEAADDAVVETVEAVVEAVEPAAEAFVATLEAAEPAPAPVEAVVAEAEPTAPATDADDLTQLVGIGPKLAASLAELGVTRFSQIAAWTPDELLAIDETLNLRGRADRDAWIAQAKRLAGAPEA